jgi:hypothetical protein
VRLRKSAAKGSSGEAKSSKERVIRDKESRRNDRDGNCCEKVNVTNDSAHGKAATNGKTSSASINIRHFESRPAASS